MNPENPIVGGTSLRIPAIQSPNFSIAGQTGWQISQNGNAYFFNITATGTITSTTVIVEGATGGVFIYSGAPALGNLIVSIAGQAGTDVNGNAYPEGINVTAGTISGITVSGSTITGTTFDGTDFIINSAGAFFYSGTPAAGNLIVSIATTSGTDTHGNPYVEGFGSYLTSGSNVYAIAIGTVGGFPGLTFNDLSSPANIPPSVSANASSVGALLELTSGAGTAAAGQSVLELLDSLTSGIVNGEAFLLAGHIVLGYTNDIVIDEPTSTITFNTTTVMGGSAECGGPAGSGPFIPGESFHAVSLGTDLSGSIRVKKLPWNAIWMDIAITDSSATAAIITCGSLPDASYYPVTGRWFPLGTNGTPSSLGTLHPNVTIPTSGAISIVSITASGAPVAYSASVMYPTN